MRDFLFFFVFVKKEMRDYFSFLKEEYYKIFCKKNNMVNGYIIL